MTITASNHNLHNQGKDQRDKTNNRLLAVVAVVAMSMVGLTSIVYGVVAAVLGGAFFLLAIRLFKVATERQSWELFKFSVFYLAALFGCLILDKLFIQQLGLLRFIGIQ